ncbi:hypothetical protein AB1Y20_013056 [Prymnesium parvum]|uniref:TRAM domain-containing protein n=1 Tax=Prymnesium parvum TaxID=97485 RepID=A0AB34ILP0_PRYPA
MALALLAMELARRRMNPGTHGVSMLATRQPPDERSTDWPFAFHELLELEIEDVTSRGDGVARVFPPLPPPHAEDPEALGRPSASDAAGRAPTGRSAGWVVLVPFCLPGEKVVARVRRNCKTYSVAELLEVRTASAERREPGCRFFGECGGCQYQHVDYGAQLRLKRSHAREQLRRIGGLGFLPLEELVLPTVGSPREYNYRSKLTPHYGEAGSGPTPIGFLSHGDERVMVDIPECAIAMEPINRALPAVRAAALHAAAREAKGVRRRPSGKPGSSLLLRATGDGVVTDPAEEVVEVVGALELRFKAADFFQNNPFLLPRLVEYVVAQAAGRGSRFLIDAYSGSGLFALSAAGLFEQILGVETSVAAVDCATRNAEFNGIRNVRFVAGKAESIFDVVHFASAETAMIIDPPRKGCDAAFLEQLLIFKPHRVVYVSCGPDTQARDLRALISGGYQLEQVQPFDMFPHTRHLETVACLQWRADTAPISMTTEAAMSD